MSNPENNIPIAEQTAVTKPAVVLGLGYPMGRDETSAEPTGWIENNDQVEKVSRETSR